MESKIKIKFSKLLEEMIIIQFNISDNNIIRISQPLDLDVNHIVFKFFNENEFNTDDYKQFVEQECWNLSHDEIDVSEIKSDALTVGGFFSDIYKCITISYLKKQLSLIFPESNKNNNNYSIN